MKKVLTLTLLSLLCMSPCFGQTASAAPAAADPFPAPNPRFFDTASPSLPTVESFLKAIWGYDENRSWRVEAIQKTPAPGVSKVTVFVADKTQGNKVEPVTFFVTPDGKHAIADSVFDFGPQPFADTRRLLESRAKGPSRGGPGTGLVLVEFADLQCPHCKEAQPTIDSLRKDFPEARFVFQNYPLSEIHPYAFKAAAFGTCMAAKSPDAFYTYLQDVFDHQESLTAELADKTLASAVEKAGGDPKATATCAASPETEARVKADVKLAEDAGVSQTPTLAINGHLLALGGMSYETLKKIVAYDASQSAGSQKAAK